ncbi:MAG: energy transducer TonB [Balneolaceae bacterium]
MKSPDKYIRKANPLKKYYLINIEIGLILSLLLTITLFKIDFYPESEELEYIVKDEIIKIEEIEQTRQDEVPPPPPRPPVPVEVPNDEIILNDEIDFISELNVSERLELPPPPRGEEKEADEEEIFVVVEQMPELIGGISSVMKHIKYPDMARMAGIEGRVIVQFIIDEKGNVVDPKVVRGIGGGCDEEAVRAVSQANFIPGMQRGKPVKVRYSMPITFSLSKSENSK